VLLPVYNELVRHHEVYNQPLKGEYLEERFDAGVNETNKYGSDWDQGSHAVSTDTRLSCVDDPDDTTASVKSGTLKIVGGRLVLSLSGSRLGKHKGDLGAMLAHLESTSADMYVSLSRDAKDWKFTDDSGAKRKVQDTDDKLYNLAMFPSYLLDYGQPSDWIRHTTDSGNTVWTLPYSPERGMSATITESKSWQVDTVVDVDRIGGLTLITVPGRKVVDKRLEEWLRQSST
jgi:hypothetical protein